MSAFNLETCARPNILSLKPYRCARDDYEDNGTNILLDANENAHGPALDLSSSNAVQSSDAAQASSSLDDSSNAAQSTNATHLPLNLDLASLHRYPDPHQHQLKQLLCSLRNTHAPPTLTPPSTTHHPPLTPANLFVGVGSDEAIDALLRCFCVPGRDRILTCPPTYGMYAVSAHINDVDIVPVPLGPAPEFALDVPAIYAALDESLDSDDNSSSSNTTATNSSSSNHDTTATANTTKSPIKLIYLCSPGNPTASLLSASAIARILAHPRWNGILVIDEAYIDFAPPTASLAPLVTTHPNLVVLQTLSKAFGLAAIRLGAAFASPPVAALLNNLKAPYNISAPTAALASAALSPPGLQVMRRNRQSILRQRDRLLRELPQIPGVGRLRGGTDANFVLFEMLGPDGSPHNPTALAVYQRLADSRGIVVRFRGNEHGCLACLRITVGTQDEVTRFLESLRSQLADIRGTS